MELHQLSAEEIRGWEPARRKEVQGEIRMELNSMRMDIYTSKEQKSAKLRGLKKSLARILTIETQGSKQAAKK